MTQVTDPYLGSQRWKNKRAAVKKRDGGCVVCGSTDALQVDHIIERVDWPEGIPGLHDPDNLQTLCGPHHRMKSANAIHMRSSTRPNHTTKTKKNPNESKRFFGTSEPHPPAQVDVSPFPEPYLEEYEIAPLDKAMLAECTGGMPRFFTGPHPRAVRSLFDYRAEAFLKEEMGITVRPWQKAVLHRALQVDEDDQLCYHVVTVSVGRQSGKTWLIRMLTNLRQLLFTEEPQQILHLARVREAGRAVLVNPMLMRWAESRGIDVRLSNGSEGWHWPDGSAWELSAMSGAYGRTANLVLLDETWDITRERYFDGVQPTTAARERAQTWFFSAAHREAEDLTPLMMERAMEGREGYMLADWGARAGDDLNDPAAWKRMGPHWDQNRARAVADAAGEDSFRTQWANIWPIVLSKGRKVSPFTNWANLPVVATPEPPAGCLIALDESYDSSMAAFIAWSDGQAWYREFGSAGDAVKAALALAPSEIIVGVSLQATAINHGVQAPLPYGARQTALSVPLVLEAVKRGTFAHEHAEALTRQAEGAVTSLSDAGAIRLSVKGSGGSVLGLKLLSWTLLRERDHVDELPQIF
jgi:hypothetical protein